MINKQREKWLDYVKAVACILVVLAHVLQGLRKSNILLNTDFLIWLDYAIYLFHMPLFFMVSGYLYKKNVKITSLKTYLQFVLKKLCNLGIPYIFFSLIFTILNMCTNSANDNLSIMDFINIYKSPISHFWFLYTLFFIFLLIPILEKIVKNENIILLFLLIIKILFNYIDCNVYFITSFASYGFYFYFGKFLISFVTNKKLSTRKMLFGLMNIIIFIILSLILFNIDSKVQDIFIIVLNIIMASYGSYIVLKLIYNIGNNKLLNILGKYSFQIYLMHTIFAAFIRVLLIKIGISNGIIQFILGMFCGFYIPIIISMILDKMIFANIIIFPIKTIKHLKKNYVKS